jgi:purine nucleosidase
VLTTNVVPPEVRVAAEAIIEPALLPCLPGPVRNDAAELLADAVTSSPEPVTLITTGPLTNVAAALRILASRPGGLAHLGHVFSMFGAVRVPGSLCCTTTIGASGNQELNAWVDPSADETVLNLVADRWTLIPLDATNDVPITQASAAAVAGDHSTPEASYAAAIASSPLLDLRSVEPVYWWDPLAAVVAVTGHAVTLATDHVQIVATGPDAGHTIVDPTGRNITFATSANPAVFQQLFQDGLDGN